MSAAAGPAPKGLRGRLGTFGGVFTPSLLTILGVIMFLRFGYVTGNAGLDRTILIVLVANAVSILTSLSLAVIATNTRVEGGGDYFLISRSVGLEFGGAIGTVLYVAQSVSVGFYVVGFTEALGQVVDLEMPATLFGATTPAFLAHLGPGVVENLVSTWAVLCLFWLAYRGADVATRFQYVIMGALFLALVSYFAGAARHFDGAMVADNRGAAPVPPGIPFWAAFAIFFPAITGFTQGVSMSGDLRDPKKSLPVGTFAAVGVSLLVYLALPVLLAGTTDRAHLLHDAGAETMKRTAVLPWLIDAGVFAATLSSALASLMGAPRILRAMSLDELFPGSRFFADDRGGGEPRRAMVLSLAIALCCIWMGDLNALAAVVTMFFLLSYGAVNYATFLEGFSRNPSFRPRFRFSGWRTSLLGAVVCAAVMLAIDPMATVVALTVLWGLHRWLVHRDLDSPAGDARRGFYLQRIKDYLVLLADRPVHARNWRPVVLAATRPGEDGRPLVRFAGAVGSEQGILTVAVVLVGRFDELADARNRQLSELDRFVRTERQQLFYEVPIADTFAAGIRSLLMIHGIGQLRPNTLLLYWEPALEAEYLTVLGDAAALQYNVVLLHPARTESPFATDQAAAVPCEQRVIDIWWRGTDNGSFALLLAHLIRETRSWHGCTIRVLRIVPAEDAKGAALQEISSLVESSRIDARAEVFVSSGDPFELISERSAGSHLVFLGVGRVGDQAREELARYNSVVSRLPTTVLVRAAMTIDVTV